jgi:hypothetical protein
MVYSFSFLPGRTTHPYRVPTISYPLVSLFRVYAWMCGCMHGCMHGCMDVCMYIHFSSISFPFHLFMLIFIFTSYLYASHPFHSHLISISSLHFTSLHFTSLHFHSHLQTSLNLHTQIHLISISSSSLHFIHIYTLIHIH